MNWVQILSALLTPLIAIIGAYIAYQQWRLNRANLKERLFNRRLEVYTETQIYLSEISIEAKISRNSVMQFNLTHQKARFLFGKDVQEYLLEIRTRSIEMMQIIEQLKTLPTGDQRSNLTKQNSTELKWMIDQLSEMPKKFDAYLSFGKHR